MGAWDKYKAADGTTQRYFKRTHPLTWFDEIAPKGYGVMSVKEELVFNGFKEGVDPLKPVIGLQAEDAIKMAQAHFGISVDGIAGPETVRYLCHKRIKQVEAQYNVPNQLICRQIHLESNFDPAAVGVVDPDDLGAAQIHMQSHPDVDDAQAFTFSFAIPWMGKYLHGLASGMSFDWDAALAAYNVGLNSAKQWKAAGKPATGGPQIGTNPDGSPRYLFTTCTEYVKFVKSQTC